MTEAATRSRWAFAVLLVVVYTGALVWSDGLRQEVAKDEVHFWETTQEWFVAPFPPTAEALSSYPELITPLSFVVWGQLDRATGDGLLAGRMLNLALSLAILLWLAFASPLESTTGLRAALGMLLFPYFIPLSVHLYTDILGAFVVLLALHAQVHGRLLFAALLFGLAICTRQYLIQVAGAVAAFEALRWFAGQGALLRVLAPGAAAATLLGWMAFWGGLAPGPGLERWLHPYPAPMLTPTEFILSHGTYFLVGIGAYFVVPEMVLWRRAPPLRSALRDRRLWVAAGLLALAFALDPPLLSEAFPGGAFGRVTRQLLDGSVGAPARLLLYYALALLAVARFLPARLEGFRRDFAGAGPGFWLVAVALVLSMKSQLPWEKYLLPCLLPLWYLRSRDGSQNEPLYQLAGWAAPATPASRAAPAAPAPAGS